MAGDWGEGRTSMTYCSLDMKGPPKSSCVGGLVPNALVFTVGLWEVIVHEGSNFINGLVH
jgi:hypothetical protein